jgi:hypothetical protein
MASDNPTGADNQQGSPNGSSLGPKVTPQRLHAELLATDAKGLEAYLQGALHDGTRNAKHRTFRIGAANPEWLVTLKEALLLLDQRSWIYREGANRRYWVLETCASFLSISFDASALIGSSAGVAYVRGYFDADGGMPVDPSSRLYLQFCQKSYRSLEVVAANLAAWGDRLWPNPPTESSCRSRLLAGLRTSRLTSSIHEVGGFLASKKASANGSQDEDIVHAPWRHGEPREQGSRTGRCGWITSFLRSDWRNSNWSYVQSR